tara:strand:+ start:413 stop:1906 length:1494 start_codon:yes stop_codon:yes gene_type:complete
MNSEQGSPASITDRWIAIRLFATVYLFCLFFMDSSPHGVFTGVNRFQYIAYALIEDHSIDISGVEKLYGEITDAYGIRGRRVPIINPGVGLLATPAYGLSSLLHVEERIGALIGSHAVITYRGLIFALAVNSPLAAVFVVSLWLMLRWLGLTRRLSLCLAIWMGWGSMAAYYFTAGTNVQTAAETALTSAAWLFIVGFERNRNIGAPAPMFVAGLFLGLAILVNVPALLTIVCTFFYILTRHRKQIWMFLGGLVPGSIILLIYQWIAVGDPFMDIPFAFFQSLGMYRVPSEVSVIGVALEFLAGRHQGLIWYFPLVTCLSFHLRNRKGVMHLAAVCWILIVGHWLFASWYTHVWIRTSVQIPSWPWYAAPGPGGPRYLLPIIPFVAILITQLDFRSSHLRTWISWMGVLGLSLNVPVLMYPAGGPVFRSFFLMMKYGMAVPLARVMAQVVPGREAVSASEVTISLTWAVVLLGLAMWMWTSSRFQDWLFEDHIVEGV